MTAFDAALAILHASTDLSVPADYRQGGQGPAARVRVIRSVLEPGMSPMGMSLRARADVVSVRVADAPQLAQGDSFTFDPDTAPTIVKVAEKPELDELGITYTAQVRRY